MTEIFDNAITSIQIGIEDFQIGSDARMISAARNYYAGLLLLAKECLVRQAPNEDPLNIIGAKFEPEPADNGNVTYSPVGYKTVDLDHIKKRFKKFNLPWPDADIGKLQRLRNDIEHYHLREPAENLKEAISSSFVMIIGFFEILQEQPETKLGSAWNAILDENNTFQAVQKKCVDSFGAVEWPADIHRLDRLSCQDCGSSLIKQLNSKNDKSEDAEGVCQRCHNSLDHDSLIRQIVGINFGQDDYWAVKDGVDPVINECPNCGAETYIQDWESEISICFSCHESIPQSCKLCEETLSVNDVSWDDSGMCSFCAHRMSKLMRE